MDKAAKIDFTSLRFCTKGHYPSLVKYEALQENNDKIKSSRDSRGPHGFQAERKGDQSLQTEYKGELKRISTDCQVTGNEVRSGKFHRDSWYNQIKITPGVIFLHFSDRRTRQTRSTSRTPREEHKKKKKSKELYLCECALRARLTFVSVRL